MITIQLYLLICILALAGKDADSFRLKDHNAAGRLTDRRINRWHRDGVLLWALITISPTYMAYCLHLDWWMVPAYSCILRAAFFDPFFNRWAGLQVTYLGGSAGWDRLFVNIFGLNGALKKSAAAIAVIIVLNIIFKSSFLP